MARRAERKNASVIIPADPGAREALSERVTEMLLGDERVASVRPFGSLVSGKADEFSDIDLMAHLRPGVVDRAFWADLPEVLGQIGPAVSGWSFQAINTQQYGASFFFDDHPLFWVVDIGCVADSPTDPSDLLATYRWEQIYKMWIGAARSVARSDARLRSLRRQVERHHPVEEIAEPDTPIRELRVLLDGIEHRKIQNGDPYEHLHRRCSELLLMMADSR
ncbi:MAG: nucleotidyltransferase domain-containing protein [Acidimicrobiales bacterium]